MVMSRIGLCLVSAVYSVLSSGVCLAMTGSQPVGLWLANGAKEVCVDVLPKLTLMRLVRGEREDPIAGPRMTRLSTRSSWKIRRSTRGTGVPVGCTTKFTIIETSGVSRARIGNYDPVQIDGIP